MGREDGGTRVWSPSNPTAGEDSTRSPVMSWLELFHPDGPPVPRAATPSPRVDVALLAPTAADLRSPAWLGQAIGRLAREVHRDGVGYIVVPRWWRARAVRLAKRHGLRAGPWLLHLPAFPASRHVIPIEPRTLRHVLRILEPGRAWKGRLLRVLLALRAVPICPWLLPSAGVVVRKPGARPLLEWFLRVPDAGHRDQAIDGRGTAVVAMSWRGPHGSLVLQRFRGDEREPDVVAKVAPTGPTTARLAEAENLVRFGPDARRAGAVVPERLELTTVGTRTVLVQTAVGGRPAAIALASGSARLPEVAERLGGWLGRWHAITRVGGVAARSTLSTLVLDGLDELAPHVSGGDLYRRWLSARCESLSTGSFPLVAAHNDLTMWNVLLGAGGAFGVVDWEHATAGSLPLVDFFYAMADAVLVSGRHTDRLAAVAACVGPGGAQAPLVTRLGSRLAADLALPPGLATLALHACWIRHGVNALAERPGAPGAQVFVAIVRWLAEHRTEFGSGTGA